MRVLSLPLLPLLTAALLLVPLPGCREAATRAPGAAPGAARGAAPFEVTFTDVAPEVGLDFRYAHGGQPPLNIKEIMGGGAAFVDYDGDGWLDVLLISYPRPALFRNEEGKRFTDVTARAGLELPEAHWQGVATGDFDNDGHTDLFLTAYNRTALLRNRGDGTFEDVTDAMGVRLARWATSAAFADVNRDGFLDLYVGCYLEFGPGMPETFESRGVQLTLGPKVYDAQYGVLFLNEGGRRFRDATRELGLDTANGKALAVAFSDASDSGYDDLYVANDNQPQDYFENVGGRFRNVALENGTAFTSEGTRQGGMGVDFADYDNDGRIDLFVANFMDEPKSLYRNLGGGSFEAAGYPAGISQTTRPWVAFGTKFFDVNHDGRLDLMILNGHVQDLIQQAEPGNSYPQKSQLFLNEGNGRFREISDQVGPDFRRPIVGRALAVGDFDNDGDLDALAADLEGKVQLWRNDGGAQAGNWLMLHLEGREGSRGNRSAIGARIEVRTGDHRQLREKRTDGSYLAAHDPRVHFGLGRSPRADEVTIRWPSGARQTLTDVPANQVLRLREPG
jgi:enediyne biosynthesis protein E4